MGPLPRRVLHVMNGAAGGAALSTIGLIERMRRAYGVESVALCHDAGTEPERRRLADACEGRVAFAPLYMWNRQIRAPGWKRPLIEVKQLLRTGALWGSTQRAIELCRAHDVELVHTNTILTLEGALAARALGLGHVWHLREMVGHGAPFRLPIEGPLLGSLLRSHASVVVANSEASAARVRNWMPRGLLAVVDNGLDLSPFAPRPAGDRSPQTASPKARLGLDPAEADGAQRAGGERSLKTVAMVGSLTSRWKQHRLFVEAMEGLEGVRARIYGHAPPDDPYVKEIVALAEARRVSLELMGFVKDPAAIMREIDVMAHPAANESFGRIVVEAWASGVPVVGVASGGVGAIVTSGHDGLLARPNDAADLRRQVARLLDDAALRRALIDQGLRTARERFSIEAHAERMAELYARAVNTRLMPLGAGLRAAPKSEAT